MFGRQYVSLQKNLGLSQKQVLAQTSIFCHELVFLYLSKTYKMYQTPL